MKKMNERELKAYRIGEKEARQRQCIVTPNQSEEMQRYLNEEQNNLLPLLKAFAKGVAAEIHRQTVAEFPEVFQK